MKRHFGLWFLFLLLFSCKTQGIENNEQQGIVAKSDKANILSYVIKDGNGQSHYFSIDNAKNTVALTLPNDHSVNLSDVTPTITISKKATITPKSEEKCNFSSDKTVAYEVISESGKNKKTYIASIKVLPPRKVLNLESIKVHGVLVVGQNVSIDEKYSKVEKSNIEIKFTGDDTPSDFSITPEVLRLNAKGDSGTITLSTRKTDVWNAWSETITIRRGGGYQVSDECSILSFVANGVEGSINEVARTVKCVLPPDAETNSITPIIKCSAGAIVSPASGEVKDFSNGAISYTVTAENGLTKRIYSVTVEKGRSNIAKITSFMIGTVSASIDHDTGKITAEVEKTIPLESISPVIEVSKGANVNPRSGVQQDFRNTITYTVTAEDGKTKKIYTVDISHKKSNEAEIKSFMIGSVSASINHDTGKIVAEVEKSVALATITPTITVSEGAIVSPASGDVKDFTGSLTTPVEYTVVSEDKTKTKIYQVTITHKKFTEAKIKSFMIGTVSANIDDVTGRITAEVEKSVALATIAPIITVSEGATVSPANNEVQDFTNSVTNPVSYTVTAEDGTTTKTYQVSITHIKSNQAVITSFNVGSRIGKINSDKTINVVVPYDMDLTTISPTIIVSDYASVVPNSGVSQDFSGAKTVSYIVTAEDGVTQNTYNVRVFKTQKNIRVTIHGEVVRVSGDKFVVSIPKTMNTIENANVQVEYTDDDSVYKIVDNRFVTITPVDQTSLNGDTGTLNLKIEVVPFDDYAGVSIDIEVSKKA